MNYAGKIITFEGPNGAGKSTQAGLLVEVLLGMGQRVHAIKYPEYETPTGQLIRAYLNGEFGPKEQLFDFAAMLYAADRMKNKPRYDEWLTAGDTIVHDRYRESNWGIQTALFDDPQEREQRLKWLLELEKGLYPSDVVFYLDVPVDDAVQLMRSRKLLDFHETDVDFMRRCETRYRELATRFSWHHIVCVEDGALRSREAIHAEVLAHLGFRKSL